MGLFSKLISKITGNAPVAESDWKELEKSLLESDLGREITNGLIDAAKKIKESPEVALQAKLTSYLSQKSRDTKSGVVLVVGVNGTGKTTSAAKLANTSITSCSIRVESTSITTKNFGLGLSLVIEKLYLPCV